MSAYLYQLSTSWPGLLGTDLIYVMKGDGTAEYKGTVNALFGLAQWQTYTPSGTNTVHIAIDAVSGRNVILNSPADNTQAVDVPLNLPDGHVMEILLAGGGASGSWTAWSSGSPSTPGWVFPAGAAPTAPASALNARSVTVRRRGVKYVAYVSGFDEVL